MSRMCTDPTIYKLDAASQAQGITDVDQLRQEILWQAAERGEVPIHTGKCPYCASLLASFQRLNEILQADEPVTLAVCPSAEAFVKHYNVDPDPAIEEHLKFCTACREDLAFLARSQEPREKALPIKRRLFWLGAAAAALVFTILPWPWNQKRQPPKHEYQRSGQYANLAVDPGIDREELLANSAPDHHTRIEKVIDIYKAGDYKTAGEYADVIYRAVDDPAAAYLQAMAQYKQGKLPEALETMRMAEAIQPFSEYRCWGALQMALMLGDRATIERELKHLSGDARCQKIRQALQG